MYVNNEVGTVQPVEEAASIVKDYNPSILFHSDAVQGFGKYRIYPKRQKLTCSVSADIRSMDRRERDFYILVRK